MSNAQLPPYLEIDGEKVVTDNILRYKYGIVTKSTLMYRVIKDALRVAQTNSPVMLVGESGTGKELIANLIYHTSKRDNNPFITVNCAAFTDTLLESELFGHQKGAFTGAVVTRDGVFHAANQGTLFLDEVSEMSPNLQAKILRAIQHGTFSKVGSYKEERADIRVIAATNKTLLQLVNDGKFREDLYYRLNVVQIALPPLRSRLQDVRVLIEYFLEKYKKETGEEVEVDSTVLNVLEEKLWPGNVRELENAVERALVMREDSTITIHDLPVSVLLREQGLSAGIESYIGLPLKEATEKFKKLYVEESLTAHNGSVKDTAGTLKIQRTYLSRILSNYNINSRDFIDRRGKE